MGCVGSSRPRDVFAAPAKTHDVCITSTSPVLSSEDFAAFFSVWIMKSCVELRLSASSGRPQLGSADPKQGSREQKALRLGLLASRVAVCIVNITQSGDWPPPGYRAELAWAEECNIPVVPFYDGDRYGWKDVCHWKVELPALFRSGLGPIKYHRSQHEHAKEQLTVAVRQALADAERGAAAAAGVGVEESGGQAEGPPLSMQELSRAERRLIRGERPLKMEKPEDAEEGSLGLQRSDYERAGLVEKKLERTNSLKDINVETALTMLAKRAATRKDSGSGGEVGFGAGGAAAAAARGGGFGDDILAARDGGCRLQFIGGLSADNEQVLLLHEPAHRVVRPVKGILKKKQDKRHHREQRLPARDFPMADKKLRLAPVEGEDRRHAFAVQQLQQHLDSLQADDVHELMTVQRCLQDGVEELGLVIRALKLIKAFLELHLSLHIRAIQQGVIPAVIAAMRKHPDIDVSVLGAASLVTLLQGSTSTEVEEGGVEAGAEAAGTEGGCIAVVAKTGGPEVISNSMKLFPGCELLQEHGCRCFGLMCQTNDDNKVAAGYKKGRKMESNIMLRSQARRLVSRHGGVQLCLDMMKKFPNNARLQAGGCMALGRIGASEVKVKKKAAKAGGVVGMLLAALAKHPRDVEVQRWGCAAVRHLASNSQENKTFIAKRGGVDRLCEAVRNFQSLDKRVVSEGLGGLCHLASKHPENKQLIFEAGALDLAVAALSGQPEAELGMAGCGLLHNLACDEEIKRHIVKLGGREIAERLASNDTQAVRNLAKVLQRTLAPPQENSNDPFGSIFATRTPGVATMRATSRRGKKKAKAAMKGLRSEGDSDEGNEKGNATSSTNDAASDSGESHGSDETSQASASSGYSGGSRRRPGHGRQPSASRRFAKAWDNEGAGKVPPAPPPEASPAAGAAGAEVRTAPRAPPQPGSGEEEVPPGGGGERGWEAMSDPATVSEMSDAESHLSLEATSHFGDADMVEAMEQLGYVRIRKASENSADSKKPKAKGLTSRMVKSFSSVEEKLTGGLDRLGQAARQKGAAYTDAPGRP